MKLSKNIILLILIVVFGGILRLVQLSSFPPSLNWDEVSHGYNAYSVLKTGRDQWGQLLPLFNFRAYGDYPLPLNLYLTIPFVAIFGLTEFAVRLPHALLGMGTILAAYYLAKGITKKEGISAIASLLVAIDPWTLFTSRFVLQSNLAVFFLTASGAFFFNREKKKYFGLISLILLELTLFSYNTTRIVSPLILILAFAVYWQELRKYLLWGIIFLIPLVLIFLSPESVARSNFVFLLDAGAVNKIESLRVSSNLPRPLSRLIYNRPVYLAENFIGNYIDYFSPKFLFLNGGTQYQFSIPNYGLSYLINLPFFYLGLAILIAKSLKSKDYRLVLGWLILAPVPAALTQEKFAVIRSTAMLPIPQILAAIGLYYVWDRFRLSWFFVAAYLITLSLLCGKYAIAYATTYPKEYSWAWQYGYKQVVEYSREKYDKYDKIIVTKKYGEPHEFFLFFLKWDPGKYQTDPTAIKFFQSNWYWIDKFDKFYFVNDWQVKDMKLESGGRIDCSNQKCLLITSPDNVPSGWKKLKTINFLDGKPDFEIYGN